MNMKDNVQLSIGHILLEFAVVVLCFTFLVMNNQNTGNGAISSVCAKYSNLDAQEIAMIDFVYALIAQSNSLSF